MKVTTKASFYKYSIPNRKDIFLHSTCIMPISVGQNLDAHEDIKLSATIKLINSSFKKCTLLIDNSIQRHTMKIWSNDDEESLYKKALLEGKKWSDRNMHIYKKLEIECDIQRWDDWLLHP